MSLSGRQSSISNFFRPKLTGSKQESSKEVTVLDDNSSHDDDEDCVQNREAFMEATNVQKETCKRDELSAAFVSHCVSNDEGQSGGQDDSAQTGEFQVETTTDATEKSNSPSLTGKNRFAHFAASANTSLPSKRKVDLSRYISAPRPAKQKVPEASLQHPAVVSSSSSSSTQQWIRMADLPLAEQDLVVEKWHSMVVETDKNSGNVTQTLEGRRFQIFVAARLHARCQDGPVRQAMKELYRKLCPAHGETLSAPLLAQVEPELWMDAIKNLQYYPTKARHLHKAANEILVNFSGKVPETEQELKTLTGIGPVLADLLAFVNTTALHQSRYHDRVSRQM